MLIKICFIFSSLYIRYRRSQLSMNILKSDFPLCIEMIWYVYWWDFSITWAKSYHLTHVKWKKKCVLFARASFLYLTAHWLLHYWLVASSHVYSYIYINKKSFLLFDYTCQLYEYVYYIRIEGGGFYLF